VAINEKGWLGVHSGYDVLVLVPEASADGPVYFRDTSPADGINDLVRALPNLPGAYAGWIYDINDAGCLVGSLSTPTCDNSTIWVGDTPIDLGYGQLDMNNAYGINNLGLTVIGPDLGAMTDGPCYVVVAEDKDGDGLADTWVEDLNGDGINDLFKLLTRQFGGVNAFAPTAINDAGQIILNWKSGSDFLLNPDYTDADGDGNPWYADVNGDGFNDRMVQLIGLGGGVAYANDLNAAGQVVGSSNGRAVRWDFAADGTQTVTDLGALLGSLLKTMPNSSALGLNDAGQIVGGASGRRASMQFLIHNGKLYDLAKLLVNGTG
jgi:uncharacterized membrane protein